MEPTVFADVTDGMRIAREEIFGPVMACSTSTARTRWSPAPTTRPTALPPACSRATSPGDTGIARLKAGTTWINAYNLTPVEMPFGGVKQSGLGRENGRAALDAYTQVKSVYVEMSGWCRRPIEDRTAIGQFDGDALRIEESLRLGSHSAFRLVELLRTGPRIRTEPDDQF